MTIMPTNLLPTSLAKIISISFVTFICVLLLVTYQSLSGLKVVTSNFNTLSDKVLPLALNNSRVAQLILKESNLVKDAVRVETIENLQVLTAKLHSNRDSIQQELTKLQQFVEQQDALPDQEYQDIIASTNSLFASADSILQLQQSRLVAAESMSNDIDTFRYGVMSIGPELSRIANMFAFSNAEAMDAANRFISNASRMESLFLLILMEKSPAKARELYKQLNTNLAGVELGYDDFKQWYNVFDDFPSFVSPYQIVRDGFKADGILQRALAQIDQFTELNVELDNVQNTSADTIKRLDLVSQHAEQNIAEKQQFVTHTIEQSRTTQLLVNFIAVILTIISGFSLHRWINQGMNAVTSGLDKLTTKDFTQRITARGPLELRKIAHSINQVIEAISDSLTQVTNTAQYVNGFSATTVTAAKQNQLALKEQNQALSGMSNMVQQIELSIREIANLSNVSFKESKRTTDTTNQGIELLEESTQTLNGLDHVLTDNESSMVELEQCVAQIQSMVDVIASIAGNTNLLALNAAIEAARAGEQGRGFSVVADEVRRLATDTATQTTRISEITDQLVKAATNSTQAVKQSRVQMGEALEANNEVKSTFRAIQHAIHAMEKQIEQISAATEEQEASTASVNQSIGYINQQGTNAENNLTEMVNVSQQLADEADQQQQMLAQYRL
jgi:methyl-accepting chemotaxis protein